MNIKLLQTIMLLLALSATTTALADRIIYTNGDELSGQILSIDKGILHFRSESAGNLAINVSEIKAIETDKQVRIEFNNEDSLTGRVTISDDHRHHIETAKFGTIEDIPFADIRTLSIINDAQLVDSASQVETTVPSDSDDSGSAASEVILVSGDRLYGKIKGIDEKNLILATDYSKDDLKISRDKITSIQSDYPLAIFFDKKDYLKGEIRTTDDNRLVVENPESGATREFQLTEVQDIYDGDPQQKLIEDEKFKFSGNLNVGIELESGNTDEDTYMFSGMFRARDPDDRITIRFDKLYEKTNGDKTEDETNVYTKYDHFFAGKWFAFAGGIFEQDRIDLLHLRTTLAAGLGYQFFETEDHFLSVDTGPAWVDEQFIEDDDGQQEPDTNFWALKWGIDYEYQLFEWARFFHFHDGLLGVEDFDDTLITSQTGFRIPLSQHFNATIQANLDWEKSPPRSVGTTDREYLITLGYKF